MSEIVIKTENISKQYQLGKIGYGTLKHDLQSWFARIRGKDDPNLKVDSSKKHKDLNEDFWALKDVSFEIKQGDTVGIIGRNGAGKSTLLKILSRTTTPTSGEIKIKGKIASLLEVGTGFHPELTGRENIYLNGAILGMRKKEIDMKFDEIIDFSGIEKFIDTPVKRYSSGMYVRLAFSVAAHLDSDILILDEVLAVGDAEFQKKCIGKMDIVAKNQGRTVLFVSHNIAQVRNLCKRGILFEKGQIILSDDMEKVTSRYFSNNLNKNIIYLTDAIVSYYDGSIDILSITLLNSKKDEFTINFDQLIAIKIQYKINHPISGLNFSISFSTVDMINIFSVPSYTSGLIENYPGVYECTVTINHKLRAGTYYIHLGAEVGNKVIWASSYIGNIQILPIGKLKYDEKRSGIINIDYEWNLHE
jgi:lipopolysaccharide transport system ATP-binding protein